MGVFSKAEQNRAEAKMIIFGRIGYGSRQENPGATFVGLGMVNEWAWKDAVRKEVHLRRRVGHDDEGRGLLFLLCLMVG